MFDMDLMGRCMLGIGMTVEKLVVGSWQSRGALESS
jgi:hypothetical protein